MIRHSHAIAAGFVVVSLAVAALALQVKASSTDQPAGADRLVPLPPSGVALTLPQGTRASFGTSVFKAEGEGSATLLSVTPENLSGPLEYLGSVLAGPERDYAGLPSTEAFPPTDTGLGDVVASQGAVLAFDQAARERGWEVLVGYRITGPGTGTHDGLRIEYEMDGERYSIIIPSELTVCSGQRGDACEHHE